MTTQYDPPISLLFSPDVQWDKIKHIKGWPNYLSLGLTEEHVPALIQIATDAQLFDSDDGWASIHAWRALAQLRATAAVGPLLKQLHPVDDDDNPAAGDWIAEEFPAVFAHIGSAAIPLLADYIAQPDHGLYAKNAAAHGLAKIGIAHPEERTHCLAILEQQLQRFVQNVPLFNGFLVGYLLDLKAIEAVETIREAFRHDAVDLSVVGDVEEAEIDLGLRRQRSTPREIWQNKVFPDRMVEEHITPTLMRSDPKTGRNDPCRCGSGKKFKKCCLH